MTTIKFFGHTKAKKYWEFSNFADIPVTIHGIYYPTTEHYFQAQKFYKTDLDYATLIRTSSTPGVAKKLSRSREHPIDPEWDTVRIEVMRKALFAKAIQSPEFRKLLLATGNALIEEASPWDSFWGTGKGGNGKNMLGKLLVELRARLKKYEKTIYE
jgi:N-glycosidase YbiA